MKKQTVKQELNGAVERFNQCLSNSGYYVKVGHRNGYTALDLHSLENNACINYLLAGHNDKQTLSYVYAMLSAIGLIQNPLINK